MNYFLEITKKYSLRVGIITVFLVGIFLFLASITTYDATVVQAQTTGSCNISVATYPLSNAPDEINVSDQVTVTTQGLSQYGEVTTLCGFFKANDSTQYGASWDPNYWARVHGPYTQSIGGSDADIMDGSIVVRCYRDMGITSPDWGSPNSPKLVASCNKAYSCIHPTNKINISCGYQCGSSALDGNLGVRYFLQTATPAGAGWASTPATFSAPGGTPGSATLGPTIPGFINFDTRYSTAGEKWATVRQGSKTAYCYVNAQSFAIHYKCSGSSCVQDPAGTYTTSDCNNSCSSNIAPTCSPQTASVAVNANVVFTGMGGNSATYNWTAAQGNPSSNGSTPVKTFTTKFASPGTATVTVVNSNNSASSNCSVNVTGAGCDLDHVCRLRNETVHLQVNSTPSGKHAFRFFTRRSTVSGQPSIPVGTQGLDEGVTSDANPLQVNIASADLSEGTYDIYYKVGTVQNGQVQFEAQTNTVTFAIVGDADLSCGSGLGGDATLRIDPNSLALAVGGDPLSYNGVYYDPDGPNGQLPEQFYSPDEPGLTWTLINSQPAGVAVANCGGVSGMFCPVKVGTADVVANFNGVQAQADLSVVSQILDVSFQYVPVPFVQPPYHDPFSAKLRATVNIPPTTAVGPVSYYFWWDCPASRFGGLPVTIANASLPAVCGDPTNSSIGAAYINLPDPNNLTKETVVHQYPARSVAYAPFVIVKRGPAEDYARDSITVGQQQVSCSGFRATSPATDYVCQFQAIVDGKLVCKSTDANGNPIVNPVLPSNPPTFSWSCTGDPACQVVNQNTSAVACMADPGTSSCTANPPAPLFSTTYELKCNGSSYGTTTVRVRTRGGQEIKP